MTFKKKLRRARPKNQYLRIQASYLQKSHPHVSLGLLAEFFALGENSESAQAYFQLAEIQLTFGNIEAALAALRLALTSERGGHSHQTDAWVCFVLLTLEHEMESQYDEALQVLAEQELLIFPYHRFIWHASNALISASKGAQEDASENARKALDAAKERHSGFRYHPKIGLVGDKYPDLERQLIELASV